MILKIEEKEERSIAESLFMKAWPTPALQHGMRMHDCSRTRTGTFISIKSKNAVHMNSNLGYASLLITGHPAVKKRPWWHCEAHCPSMQTCGKNIKL
jgi:hypothetical protein